MRLHIVTLLLLCVTLSACGNTPSPDIEATAQAALAAAQAAQPAGMSDWPLTLEDGFDDSDSGFYKGSYAHGRWFYEDGRYGIEVTKENWAMHTSQGNFSDFALEVDVTSQNDVGSAGVVFRVGRGGNQYYRFHISTDGRYSLDKMLGEENEKANWETILPWQKSPYLRTGLATNRLRVVCRGSEIWLYVNDQQLDTVEDTSFTAGAIGMIATELSGDGSTLFTFDNLRVYTPPREHHNIRGDDYYSQGDYERAIAEFTKAIELDSDYTDAYTNRGWAHYNLGDYDQAIANFNKAIELSPDYARAYTARGNAYHSLGDHERAIADFTKVTELDPDYAYTYIRRGAAYYASGNPEQAFLDFDKVIEIDSNPARAHNNVAWALAYDLDTHYEEALEHALRSVELNSYAYNHDTLALVYYKLEQYEKALEHYNIALSLNDESIASYKGRGDVYLALEDVEAALADYETYLSLASPGPERAEIEEKIKSLQ